jgi:hypothetical protein
MITPQRLQEWEDSGVDRSIIDLNVRSLKGDEPYNHLLQNFDNPRTHKDAQWRHVRKRYGQWESGGWWCNGLDPLNGWRPMDWGGYKPNTPRRTNDGTLIKYEHPVQTKTRAFYLRVTREVWRLVAKRSEIELPDLKAIPNEEVSAAFWRWVVEKNISIAITEGAKKAGALLSAGYAAIALPGITSGYRNPRDENGKPLGNPFLIPEIECIATPKRTIYICFDQDVKQKTIRAVNGAIGTFGKLLEQQDCEVKVVSWMQPYKGVDDLIAACGLDAFDTTYTAAVSLETWKAHQFTRLTYPTNITLNQRRIGELSIPDDVKLVGIKGAKSVGKTWTLEREVEKAIAAGKWVLVAGHRVQLVEALCKRFGINYVTDVRDSETGKLLGFGLCIDSLHPESQARFSAENWHDGIVIIDEAEQVIWHGLNSKTCQSDRVPILRELKTLLTNVLQGGGRVYLSDADLSDLSINYVRELSETNIQPFIVVNEWKPSGDECWDITTYEGKHPGELVAALRKHIEQGGKPFVVCSAQKLKSKWSTQNLETYFLEKFPALRILRIDSESVSDPSHPAYGCIANLNEVLRDYDMVLASPSIETGVSIDIKGHFTSVWGIAQGVQPVDSVRQALARLREAVPRHIWAVEYGIGRIGNGSTSVKSLLASQYKLVKANIQLLKDADFEDIDTDFQPASLRTWAKMAARINLGMGDYRKSLVEGLKAEGHRVDVTIESLISEGADDTEVDDADFFDRAEATEGGDISDAMEEIRDENHWADAEAIEESPELTQNEYEVLKDKKAKTKAERRRERKHELEQRYAVPCTADLVIKDDDGWYSKLRLHYYLTLGRDYLKTRDTSSLKAQRDKGQGSIFIPDANRSQLSMAVKALGDLKLLELMKSLIQDGTEVRSTDEVLTRMTAIAKTNKWEIKTALNISINEKDSPVAIAQKLLGKVGLNLGYLRREGSRDNRQRVYGYFNPLDGRDEVFTAWLQRDREALEKAASVSACSESLKPAFVSTPGNKDINTPMVDTKPMDTSPKFQSRVGEVDTDAEAVENCLDWLLKTESAEDAQDIWSVVVACGQKVLASVRELLPSWKWGQLAQWGVAV